MFPFLFGTPLDLFLNPCEILHGDDGFMRIPHAIAVSAGIGFQDFYIAGVLWICKNICNGLFGPYFTALRGRDVLLRQGIDNVDDARSGKVQFVDFFYYCRLIMIRYQIPVLIFSISETSSLLST